MKTTAAALSTLLLAGCALSHGRAQPQRADLALVNVRVIEIGSGRVLQGRTVLIEGNKVVSVEPMGRVRPAEGVPIVRGEGRYLIPGLWDMHVHVMYRGGYDVFGPLFVAHGVTGIRDMGNSPMSHVAVRSLRERVMTGGQVGPRFIAAGPLLDGVNSFWPFAIQVATADRGRAVVDSLHQEGAPFLKVYSSLSREAYAAILERAHELGLPVDGHVPTAVQVAEAAQAGQRSMEHLLGMSEACAANAEEMVLEREAIGRARAGGDRSLDLDAENRRLFAMMVFDERKCKSLHTQLARIGMWHVPTLVVHRAGAFPVHRDSTYEDRLRFVASGIRSWWREPGDTSAPAWGARRKRYEHDAKLVGAMHRAGVRILAGSDAPNRHVFPAFALHDELAALVEAGLTPLAALRAATLEPAHFLQATDSLGEIRPGRVADLVLLDANPLVEIRHTQRIAAVVLNGHYLDRAALDRLIDGAAARAAESGN